jgi:V-type H+-transporting ATPase subunit a
MDFVRSEKVELIQLIIPESSSKIFMNKIGREPMLHFLDLNQEVSKQKRTYSSRIALLESLEKRGTNLVSLINQEGFFMSNTAVTGKSISDLVYGEGIPEKILEYDSKIIKLSEAIQNLKNEYISLCHQRDVYKYVIDYLKGSKLHLKSSGTKLISKEKGGPTSFTCGLIEEKRYNCLQRLLFRAMRGNIIFNKFNIEQDNNSVDESKRFCGFLIFSVSGESSFKIESLCKALNSIVIQVEVDDDLRRESLNLILAKIDDIYNLLYETQRARRFELSKISEDISNLISCICIEKEVLKTFNLMKKDNSTNPFFISEAWIQVALLPRLDKIIEELDTEIKPIISVLKRKDEPPTKFPENEIFGPFELLTDSYGVPSFGEINPSIFMISTFPFIFGVMFGDIGHALIVIFFASMIFLLKKKKILDRFGIVNNSTLKTVLSNRYLLLLLGFHSLFAGIIYNDFFSRSIKIFPSSFKIINNTVSLKKEGYVYPLGIDPLWNISSNKLVLFNSYKMKQSIVLGIIHMIFGMFLHAMNLFHADDFSGIFYNFIPKILFFICSFGYLGFLIVFKWIVPVDISLISVFINMILGFGKVSEDLPIMFRGQEIFQKILMAIMIITIPIMLGGETAASYIRRRKLNMVGYKSVKDQNVSIPTEKISDLFMNNVIHSIEFILGSVSNTASYLRLWALSLAHAQLSEVLWDMVLLNSIGNPIKLIIAFPFWAIFTISILVLMEGMSAFLHALRLHWVEFNNKFFNGNGYKFEPFDTTETRILCEIEK